jgi:hypothetical protein
MKVMLVNFEKSEKNVDYSVDNKANDKLSLANYCDCDYNCYSDDDCTSDTDID